MVDTAMSSLLTRPWFVSSPFPGSFFPVPLSNSLGLLLAYQFFSLPLLLEETQAKHFLFHYYTQAPGTMPSLIVELD